MQALDVLTVFRSGGLPERPSAGSHEAIARLESVVRLVALLGAAATRAEQDPVRLPRATGLGAWIATLRQVSAHLSRAAGGTPAAAAVDGLLATYDTGVPSAPPNLRSTKALRDHLQHGGTLSAASEQAAHGEIRAMTEQIIVALNATLDGAKARTDEHDQSRVTLTVGDVDLPLWPYFYVDSRTGAVCGYAQYLGANPTYLSFGEGSVRLAVADDAVISVLHNIVASKRRSGQFDMFVRDVRQDLVGFAESDDEPSIEDRADGFEIVWRRATSEGSDLRCDQFRLGPDDEKQWLTPSGKWLPYSSSFLQGIAHWNTVASRFRQALERINVALDDEERDSLGWEPAGVSVRAAKLRVYDLGGDEQHDENGGFESLFASVDRDLQSNRGETQIVFINGEAGIGKTRAMVDAALRRAREVEDGDDLPLFLYVRSTGHVLDNLSTVVSAAVATTRNLTDEAVRALCRNGRMTVLIDGFDELLGAGYRDAIMSLRNWVADLGGRGVVVLSARSSYYLGQYRSNLDRLNNGETLAVRHRIAEVQRWSDAEVHEYLADFNVSSERVDSLSEPDRNLLGLPFFARAFAEMCRAGERVQPGASLADRLIDVYLGRESKKLDSTGLGNPLLDRDELRRLFELLAGDMAKKEEREAGIGDLELNAAIVVDDLELVGRPGLKDRLSVLCGLSTTSENSVSAQRFRFQHELFFDEFLAGAAVRLLKDGREGQFINEIGVTEWRAATVHGVVRRAGPAVVAAALAARKPEIDGQPGGSTCAAINRGNLWSAVLQADITSTYVIDGAVFTDDLDLSESTGVDLVLRDCRVASLQLPDAPGWRINLIDTAVEELRMNFADRDLSCLRGVRHRDMLRLITRSNYMVRPAEILEALVQAGAEVVDRPVVDTHVESEVIEAARWFLRRMKLYGEYRLVVRDVDLQPEQGDLGWSQTYTPVIWNTFVRALLDAGLADSVGMASQGATKIRIRVRASIQMILGAEEAPENLQHQIDAFWNQLRLG